MSKLRYKYCVVPGCKNTTVRAPHKLYFSIPSAGAGAAALRARWSRAMGRDDDKYKPLRHNRFCCEDHFDLHHDMENYMQWKLVGVKILKLRKGVLPHKFDCQRGMQRNKSVNAPELEQVDKETNYLCIKKEIKDEIATDTEINQEYEHDSSISTSVTKSHEITKTAIESLSSSKCSIKEEILENMYDDIKSEYDVVKSEYESD